MSNPLVQIARCAFVTRTRLSYHICACTSLLPLLGYVAHCLKHLGSGLFGIIVYLCQYYYFHI